MTLRLSFLSTTLVLFSGALSAQVSPAGHWRTLHSEHFRIHFLTGYDSAAHHTMREAEQAYYLLSTELVPPRQSIDLVLSDAADFSNGVASIFPSNRITLLLAPPTGEPDLQNFDDWVRLVVTHELAHIFHLDRVKGPWRALQSLLGRVPGAFPNLYQPSWVTEGIATYYESRFTRRGRVRGSFHSEVLLSLAAAHRWPRPNEATYLSEKWPDGIAPYAFGSRFFSYFAAAAGDSAVPRYVERTSGQWIPFRTGRPLRRATQMRRDSLWDAYADGYLVRAANRPGSSAQIVARGLRAQPSLAIADDGTLAWFETSLDEAAQIVIRSPSGTETRQLTTGGLDLAWSGDTLYVTRLDLVNPTEYRSDLYRLVEGKWEQLTHGARLTDLATGPNGVVAVQITGTGNRLVRVTGNLPSAAGHAPTTSAFATPAIDSAGKIVVAWHYQGRHHLLAPGDSVSNVVVTGGSNEVLADPTWVRFGDGGLLYVSDRTGLPQIYLMADGGSVRQITDEPFGARQPVTRGDGWLYFSSMESDGYVLKRIAWPDSVASSTIVPMDPVRDTSVQMDNSSPILTRGEAFPTRVTGYHPWPALRPHYFIPYLVSKGSAGYFLGGFTSGSDPLNRFDYAARVAGGLDGGRLDASLSMMYRRWDHHSIDVYLAQDNGDAGVLLTPGPVAVRSRERDAEVGLNSTWRRWYRSVTVRIAADYEEDRFFSDPSLNFINPEFAAGSVGLTLGRILRPPLAISNEDGATFSVRYRRRWRLDQDGGSDEWRGRLALYRAIKGIGGFAHPVLAARISAAQSAGPDRETFGIGGASGVTYQPLPGIVAGSGRAFPVRGFEGGELRGGRVAVASVEFRVPIALVAQPFWDLPYGLDRVSLRIFYDYGRVGDPPAPGLPHWIHSAGVEVTWDLLVLYDVPLRLRSGAAIPLNDGTVSRRGDVRFGIGFGSEF